MSANESRNVDFKRRIHYEANKYLDILTIMQQLERNGYAPLNSYIDKFYDLLCSIYESEHQFTISELRKVAKKAKENREVFDFMDHYSTNTSIFKQNLTAILEMFGSLASTSRHHLERQVPASPPDHRRQLARRDREYSPLTRLPRLKERHAGETRGKKRPRE